MCSKSTLYVYEPEAWEKACNRQYEIIGSAAGCKEVADGILLPMRLIPKTAEIYGDGLFEGGICDAEGHFVTGQRCHYDKDFSTRSCIRSYEIDPVELEYCDETVIFGGVACRHWGHMLLDTSSRLWYPVLNPDLPYKTVFIRFPKQDFPHKELMDLVGMDESRYMIIDRPTRFRKVIIPDEAFFSLSGHFRREWLAFFDAALAKVEPAIHKKVYLTRTAFGIDNVVGEQFFEDFYVSRGYEVFSPEKMSVHDQIALMKGADEIVTTMGTISHMAVFAHRGAKITVLNRSRTMVPAQLSICEARELSACYVEVYDSFLPEVKAGTSVVLVAPNRNWRNYVKDTFAEKFNEHEEEEILRSLFLEYIKKWAQHYLDNPRLFRWVSRQDSADLISHISQVFLNKQIDPDSYMTAADLQIRDLQNRYLQLEKDYGKLQARYDGLRHSFSWRSGRIITWPLRVAQKLFHYQKTTGKG